MAKARNIINKDVSQSIQKKEAPAKKPPMYLAGAINSGYFGMIYYFHGSDL